jgi:glutamine amidotransferase
MVPDADMSAQIVYKGVEPIQLSHLVTRPKHSITNQAFESKLRMPSSRPMNVSKAAKYTP